MDKYEWKYIRDDITRILTAIQQNKLTLGDLNILAEHLFTFYASVSFVDLTHMLAGLGLDAVKVPGGTNPETRYIVGDRKILAFLKASIPLRPDDKTMLQVSCAGPYSGVPSEIRNLNNGNLYLPGEQEAVENF